MTEYNLSARPTHSRWNRALPPRLTIEPGKQFISNVSTRAAHRFIHR